MSLCRYIILGASIVGVVLIILGAVLGFSVLPDYVHDEIAKQVRLEDDTDQYNRWQKLPFALTFKVYIFEITNPEAVVNEGAVPDVLERGPYVYEQRREKLDIVRNSAEDTLTYRQEQYFTFNQELSGENKQTDSFYVLNPPLMGIIDTLEELATTIPILWDLFNSYWEGVFKDHTTVGPFVKITVEDFLFNGFNFCSDMTNDLCPLLAEASSSIKTIEEIKDDDNNTIGISFAFFRHKNNADDGEYTIIAGMDIVEDIGEIIAWEGNDTISTWVEDTACNVVKGRDSTVYPPYIEEEDMFDIFSTDICRVVTLEYFGDEEYEGIDGQRRHLQKTTLWNNGTQECYCIKKSRNLVGELECLPGGFVDLYNCMGSAVVLSFPHFLWATDEAYTKSVTGLSPNEDDHITYVVLEPGTGYPLKGGKRVQFNMIMRKIENVIILKDVSSAVVPLIWVEEGVALPDDLVDELKDKYLSKLVLVDAVTWTLIAVGIALFIGMGSWFIFKKK